jgi:hypothetical protein
MKLGLLILALRMWLAPIGLALICLQLRVDPQYRCIWYHPMASTVVCASWVLGICHLCALRTDVTQFTHSCIETRLAFINFSSPDYNNQHCTKKDVSVTIVEPCLLIECWMMLSICIRDHCTASMVLCVGCLLYYVIYVYCGQMKLGLPILALRMWLAPIRLAFIWLQLRVDPQYRCIWYHPMASTVVCASWVVGICHLCALRTDVTQFTHSCIETDYNNQHCTKKYASGTIVEPCLLIECCMMLSICIRDHCTASMVLCVGCLL